MGQKVPNKPPSIKEFDRCDVSLLELEKVFTEWDRRYRKEPERFMSEATHLLKDTPKTYGEACAPYFMKLINEIKGHITSRLT